MVSEPGSLQFDPKDVKYPITRSVCKLQKYQMGEIVRQRCGFQVYQNRCPIVQVAASSAICVPTFPFHWERNPNDKMGTSKGDCDYSILIKELKLESPLQLPHRSDILSQRPFLHLFDSRVIERGVLRALCLSYEVIRRVLLVTRRVFSIEAYPSVWTKFSL